MRKRKGKQSAAPIENHVTKIKADTSSRVRKEKARKRNRPVQKFSAKSGEVKSENKAGRSIFYTENEDWRNPR